MKEEQVEIKDQIRNVLSEFNPLYLWISIIWLLSKIYQYVLNNETTVWECLWQKFLKIYGKSIILK